MLLVGYRGYGGNPGQPTETGLYQDGRAHLDWLKSQGVFEFLSGSKQGVIK
jgi:hypothetical protein